MARDFDPVTLRLFIAVCEEGNIARAAEREAIVASAVSKRIAAVEAEIGTALLVRGRRGIRPTAAGEVLLRQARELLGAMTRMQAELSEFASGVQGSVRVVASPSVLAEHLANDIGSFLAAHPQVRVTLDERVSPEIVRAVREGAAELGVLWDATDTADLQAVPYRSDRLCVAMPATHALARRKRLSYAEAIDHVRVGVAPGGMMDVLLRREAARLGRTPVHRIQVSGMDAAARIVAAGLGPAVLPREAVEGHASAKALALVPLSDPWAQRRFLVVTRADGSVTATTRLLVRHLHHQADGSAARG
ncbi:MAG: LysR family transcriptional regulator [Rubrivivax sp.]|nr:LysR family transcriptional regulator [Rubrivivax sp.]